MASTPLLSLVFPVADRVSELLSTVDGILRGNSLHDVEIVVSDNRPDPDPALRWPASDIRVSVVRPSRHLHMTDNFEFAASHASGDWMMFLGADDGILNSRLSWWLTQLANSSTGTITGPTIGYTWPSADAKGEGQLAWWEPPTVCLDEAATAAARHFTRAHLLDLARLGSYRLPSAYMHGAIRKELVAKIRTRHGGRLFRTEAPDLFLSMALLHSTESFEVTNAAFGIQGVSTGSNGRSAKMLTRGTKPALIGSGSNLLGDTHGHSSFSIAYVDAWLSAQGRNSSLSWAERQMLVRSLVQEGEAELASDLARGSQPPAYPGQGHITSKHLRWSGARGFWAQIQLRRSAFARLRAGFTYMRKTSGDVLSATCAADVVGSDKEPSTPIGGNFSLSGRWRSAITCDISGVWLGLPSSRVTTESFKGPVGWS